MDPRTKEALRLKEVWEESEWKEYDWGYMRRPVKLNRSYPVASIYAGPDGYTMEIKLHSGKVKLLGPRTWGHIQEVPLGKAMADAQWSINTMVQLNTDVEKLHQYC